MIRLSSAWVERLRSQPETGMGYQIVSVTLRDGRRYDQVIVDSGRITRVRDFQAIPFEESEIADITVTHDKWDFNRERAGR
jgi:hypothetical protein